MHALLVTISKCDAQSLGMSRSMLAPPPAPHKRELCLLCIFQKQRDSHNIFFQASSHLKGHRDEIMGLGLGAECMGVCDLSIESLIPEV